ncbi:hypothetical protein WA026_010659 [Henosepilachna vigintioctopunctata]|uniref:Uncharacterized protein n=1 Tax=Henosepilachna vigintioctopunctata TaxID=420089 RepID=A0AAW1UVJ6_9CUCU
MAQITGKYELVKSEYFAEHLVALGLPKDKAQDFENIRAIHEFTQNGDKISFVFHVDPKYHSEFILGQEVEEIVEGGAIVKNSAYMDGNKLIVKSKLPDGKLATKIHTFSDTGLTLVFQVEDPAVPDAVRVFKRL